MAKLKSSMMHWGGEERRGGAEASKEQEVDHPTPRPEEPEEEGPSLKLPVPVLPWRGGDWLQGALEWSRSASELGTTFSASLFPVQPYRLQVLQRRDGSVSSCMTVLHICVLNLCCAQQSQGNNYTSCRVAIHREAVTVLSLRALCQGN